jgi:type I restriction enzyme M protein
MDFHIKKEELRKISNLKEKFSEINRHLYAKLKYTHTDTRTRSKEIINLLISKLEDEIQKAPSDYVEFSVKIGESEDQLFKRVQAFFEEHVKARYREIFSANEKISLNKELVYFVVKELQEISLIESSKDILSDAYEIFVSKILKDEAGQFFTPSNVIKFMVQYLNPSIESKILDPACGHGGFLLHVKDHLWEKVNDNGTRKKLISNLFGIDKDLFLAKICKLYLEILSGGKSHVFCENSLDPESYRTPANSIIKEDMFDYIFTNPPFGAKIPITEKAILKNYHLAHVWKNIGGKWKMQEELLSQQSPQILFIERCVQLLKNKGKLGIILPEGIFGNPSDRFIWEYLTMNGKILGVVSLDQNLFQPYTCNKTSILFFEKSNSILTDYFIDLAIVSNVGHDKDGKVLYKLNKDGSEIEDANGQFIINDELIDLHIQIKNCDKLDYTKHQNVFKIKYNQIQNHIFIPTYYTGVERTLKTLESKKKYILESIQSLANRNIIYTNRSGYLPRGNEIGSSVYGLGEIPFIRTSELNNWEINLDSHKKTSEEVYIQFKAKQNIEEGDILLVKDGGPNLIGRTAYITELDTKIIIQSHLYQIKILANEEAIDSYLLLYLLNLNIVQEQIKAITFVQGTIATLGNRIMEVKLPLPVEIRKRKQISNNIKKIIDKKVEIRKQILNLTMKL